MKQEPKQLSLAWEVDQDRAALEAVRRQLLLYRDEGLQDPALDHLELLSGMAAGLSLLSSRLFLLVRALDGRLDPALLMAEHNSVHPDEVGIAGTCIASWPGGVAPKDGGERAAQQGLEPCQSQKGVARGRQQR